MPEIQPLKKEKSPMTHVPALPVHPLPRLFLMPLNTELHQFLVQAHKIVRSEPAILERIESDLDAYGLKKKLVREADRRFLEGQTPDLECRRIFSFITRKVPLAGCCPSTRRSASAGRRLFLWGHSRVSRSYVMRTHERKDAYADAEQGDGGGYADVGAQGRIHSPAGTSGAGSDIRAVSDVFELAGAPHAAE